MQRLFLIGLLLMLATHAHARPIFANFYVATNGKDTWSGHLPAPNKKHTDGPLATLPAALEAARKINRHIQNFTGINIFLRSGNYALSQTVALTNKDSGPLTIDSYPKEQAHLLGGKELTDWKPVTDADALKRLPAESAAHVVQCDLKANGITNTGAIVRDGWASGGNTPGPSELFFADRPMTIARWPNVGYAALADVPKGGGSEASFQYAGDRPTRWKNAPDGWVHGYWQFDWADSYTPIAAIDPNTHTLKTGGISDDYGFRKGQRWIALNLLEELDSPGEYYLDRKTNMLYFWPPAPLTTGKTYLSLMDKPLITLKNTQDVTIQGLILEDTRGEGIHIEGGTGNLIAGCTFRNMGLMGVRVVHSDSATVQSCDLYNMGQGGISLDGGDRMTLDNGSCFAYNNLIHDYSNWIRCYRPAIGVSGFGQTVQGNLIYNGPHTAILLSGNNHQITRNEIHHVCTDTGDVGAFYMGRDWTMRDNLIFGNYFHHLGGFKGEGFTDAMGVYLDDAASGADVGGNIFYKAGRAVMIGGGRDNRVYQNRFIECSPSVHVDARGISWAKDHIKKGGDWQMYEKLDAVHFDKPPYSTEYPALANILNDEPDRPKGTRVEDNIAFGGTWTELQDGLTEAVLGFKNNVVKPANPYVGLSDRQVMERVLKDYPVDLLWAVQIGLHTDEYRKTLPAPVKYPKPKAK